MKATVNGALRDLPDGLTVGGLLELLGSGRNGVAVARNDRIVRNADYDAYALCEGDRVEIITAVAGG